jgi:hypothetical protein
MPSSEAPELHAATIRVESRPDPWRWLVIIGAPLVYLACSLPYTGPAYLTDEIGYLSNAIFLSGYLVDGASSYHAGYSFLLAPLFAVLDDTASIWRGAMLLNAVLWAVSFHLLDRILTRWAPDASPRERLLILLAVALYPSWVTMAGYVFPTSAFVPCFLAAILALSGMRDGRIREILPFTLWLGLLYWIHPTGLAVAAASVLVLGAWAFRRKVRGAFLVHALGVAALILAYAKGIHPWLARSMTPEGFQPFFHYPDAAAAFAGAGTPGFWMDVAVKFLGQLSYMIVGSFGLAAYGFLEFVSRARRWMTTGTRDWTAIGGAFMVLSLFGVIGLSDLSLGPPDNIAHWIYGRYLDAVAPLFIAVGVWKFLYTPLRARIVTSFRLCVFLGAVAACLGYWYVPMNWNNLLMTPAFWPQYVAPKLHVALWLGLGAIGVLFMSVSGRYGLISLMLALFLLCASRQAEWHSDMLKVYSRPSSLVEVIRKNYAPGTCIGLDAPIENDPDWDYRQRFSLYRFYLYDYAYRRMTREDWLAGCDGPYLTYHPERFTDDGCPVVLVRENASGLFLVMRDCDGDGRSPLVDPVPRGVAASTQMDAASLISGCFSMDATDLAVGSEVGKLRDGRLVCDGRAGFLVYRGYGRLDRGSYMLRVRGSFSGARESVLDVVSKFGKVMHFKQPLDASVRDARELAFRLDLTEEIRDIEVRIKVGAADDVAVDGYSIELNRH